MAFDDFYMGKFLLVMYDMPDRTGLEKRIPMLKIKQLRERGGGGCIESK